MGYIAILYEGKVRKVYNIWRKSSEYIYTRRLDFQGASIYNENKIAHIVYILAAANMINCIELGGMFMVVTNVKYDTKTKLLGMLGYPLGHSVTSIVHNAMYQWGDINAIFIPMESRR